MIDVIDYLTYIANEMIMLGFTIYILLLFLDKECKKSNGFNITKDLLDEYDSINIIENR